MRISAVKGDPGYTPAYMCSDIEILLDGKEVKYCLTADDQFGLVVKYAQDQKGLIFQDKDGNPVIETLKGKVEIKLGPNAQSLMRVFKNEP